MAMNVKNTSTSEELDQSLKIQTTTSEEVDRASGTEEPTIWQSSKWPTYNAYYKKHSSVKAVINKLGMWAIGKGVEADKRTMKILDKIVGWGKETAAQVFDNQIRIEHVNGDSYAHIITTDGEKINKTGGNLLNLKPLNPGVMQHVVRNDGILIGYKQTLTNGQEKDFDVEDIFHLTLNRTADEIHGTGDVESIMTFLDKIKQLDEDMSVMFHQYVVPMIIWKLNTDDAAAIADFATKEKEAWNKGRNLIVPDKAVEWSLVEAGKNGVNPMDWRNKWVEEVIKGGGVPALILAIEAGTTEASSKMIVFVWAQTVEKIQRDFEAQVKLQLHLEIKLPDPPKIDQSLANDEKKDANPQTKIKPSDTKV